MSSSTQYILTRDDDQFSTRAANSDLHERRSGLLCILASKHARHAGAPVDRPSCPWQLVFSLRRGRGCRFSIYDRLLASVDLFLTSDTPMTYRQSRSNSIDSLNLTPDIVCVYWKQRMSSKLTHMGRPLVPARVGVPPDGVMLALEEKRPCNAYSLESYLTDFNLDIA
ncbi:hypothetical protein C8J57DRAFT_1541266 [Mycena rebaudengoi]|nr:hypothetical protein C8J57DRAFT_1541266 [Mycena rebaudengoi]